MMELTHQSDDAKAEFAHRLSFARLSAATTVTLNIIKWGALVLIARYLFFSILSLSGKQTFADIGVRFLGNFQVSDGILALVTTGSILYGVGERQLRHRSVKRLAKEKNELELLIDPKRSSSGLTETGRTRPEDKL